MQICGFNIMQRTSNPAHLLVMPDFTERVLKQTIIIYKFNMFDLRTIYIFIYLIKIFQIVILLNSFQNPVRHQNELFLQK